GPLKSTTAPSAHAAWAYVTPSIAGSWLGGGSGAVRLAVKITRFTPTTASAPARTSSCRAKGRPPKPWYGSATTAPDRSSQVGVKVTDGSAPSAVGVTAPAASSR